MVKSYLKILQNVIYNIHISIFIFTLIFASHFFNFHFLLQMSNLKINTSISIVFISYSSYRISFPNDSSNCMPLIWKWPQKCWLFKTPLIVIIYGHSYCWNCKPFLYPTRKKKRKKKKKNSHRLLRGYFLYLVLYNIFLYLIILYKWSS